METFWYYKRTALTQGFEKMTRARASELRSIGVHVRLIRNHGWGDMLDDFAKTAETLVDVTPPEEPDHAVVGQTVACPHEHLDNDGAPPRRDA